MQVFTKSFSIELFLAIHDFSADEIKIALYDSSEDLGADTAEYTPMGEVVGTGYEEGGAELPLSDGYPKLDGGFGAVRFGRAEWPPGSTFVYQKALIYNASKDNRSIFVVDFRVERGPSNGTHFIELPESYPPFLLMNRGVAA